jgi:hypothetical protein
MQHVKWLGIAVLAAVVTMALVGAPSASAAQPVLCKVEEAPCAPANRWEMRPFEAKAEPLKLLLGALGEVVCKSSTVKGELGEFGAPQKVTLSSLVFAECKLGTSACAFNVLSLGKLDLLRTNLNSGEATFLGTEVLVQCGSFIHCVYGGEPKLALAGKNGAEAAKLTANQVVLPVVSGFLCPTETKLDATYTILIPLPAYVEA